MTDLSEMLLECGAILRGEFTLASGEKSDYYIDIKRASTDPDVLVEMARAMASKADDEGVSYDRVGGVVLGSIPIAVAFSIGTGTPLVMVRKGRKGHGTSRLIEGPMDEGDRVLMVEDVVTSGGSVADAVDLIRGEGAIVEDVIAVIDRESGATELLASKGVRLHSLLRASDIVG